MRIYIGCFSNINKNHSNSLFSVIILNMCAYPCLGEVDNMTFNYDDLLKRACDQMPEVQTKRERLELPRIMIQTVGMRTIINNFKEISDALDRDPQHLLKFLTREMATAATFHDNRAIFQGKFRVDSFERLLQRYMEGYVVCPVYF